MKYVPFLILLIACQEFSSTNKSAPEHTSTVGDSVSFTVIDSSLNPPPSVELSTLDDSIARKRDALEASLVRQGLVNVQEINPSLMVDLKYASEDNFLKKNVYYSLDKCFLQKEVAVMLAKAQDYLSSNDSLMHIIVFDGVRPRSVQFKMWEIVEGTDMQAYVASPYAGSMHNYGAAVDVGLYHKDTGLVDMGTPFDFFGDLAQPRYETKYLASGELTKEQHAGRMLLRKSMRKAGFVGILNEWWHYNAFPKDTVRKKYVIVD